MQLHNTVIFNTMLNLRLHNRLNFYVYDYTGTNGELLTQQCSLYLICSQRAQPPKTSIIHLVHSKQTRVWNMWCVLLFDFLPPSPLLLCLWPSDSVQLGFLSLPNPCTLQCRKGLRLNTACRRSLLVQGTSLLEKNQVILERLLF